MFGADRLAHIRLHTHVLFFFCVELQKNKLHNPWHTAHNNIQFREERRPCLVVVVDGTHQCADVPVG